MLRRFLPLLAPLLTLGIFLLTSAHPLHALEFPDPDFGYLFSSLTILDGARPWHIDHPGTPLQLLGALVMAVRFFFASVDNKLAQDFFRDPLSYHQATLTVCFLLFALAQWRCGKALEKLGVSPWIFVFAQFSPFLIWEGVVYLDHVSPETLLAATLLLLTGVLAPGRTDQPLRRQAIKVGFLLGLACALKLTAAPLLLLIFLLPAPKARLVAGLTVLLSFAACTFPIWPEFPRLLGWIAHVSFQSGSYGTGMGTSLLEGALANPGAILGSAPVIFALLYCALVPLAFNAKQKKFAPLPWPIGAAAICLLLIVLKQPSARYLITLAPLASLAALHVCDHPVFGRQLRIGFFFITLVPLMAIFPLLWANQIGLRARVANNIELLQGRLQNSYKNCHITVIDDVGIPAFTLFSGNLATNNERYGAPLRELYPQFAFRSPNFNSFRVFGGPIADSQWARRAFAMPCRIFLGKQDYSIRDFTAIFGAAPLILEEIGPYKYYKVMALPAALEEKFRRMGTPAPAKVLNQIRIRPHT